MAYTYTNIRGPKQDGQLRVMKMTVAIDGATGTRNTPFSEVVAIYFTITSGTGGAGTGSSACRVTPSTTNRGVISFAGWTGDEVVEVTVVGKL